MDAVRGTVEATVHLTKNNCYYMCHGVCSLSLIEDFYISHHERTAQNDLFYCPRLYAQMTSKDKDRPVTAVPCDCGHVQITSTPQRACIAHRKELVLSVKIEDQAEGRALCDVCGGQTTLQPSDDTGKRILPVTVLAIKSP